MTEDAGGKGAESLFAPMEPLDWVLVVLLSVFLFAVAAYRSRARLFWADELISYQLFSDPSFAHRLRAWYKGADSGGLTFYLLCPLWLRLFGLNALSLRLFSTAGMCVALALLWTTLRRYVSTCLTAIAIGIVFLTPPPMLWQELNGRFYGLFFAFACFASLMFVVVVEQPRPSRRVLTLLFLSHAGLVASHIFGLIFSASLVVGMWAADRICHRTRWPVYLLPASGWLLALISLPSLRASASVVKNVFWTQRPDVSAFLYSFAEYGRVTAILLGALLAAGLLKVLVSRSRAGGSFKAPLAPAALIGSFILAALVFFAKSQTGISIFADRYLLPLLIASALMVAGVLSVLLPRTFTYPRSPAAAGVFSLLVLLPVCVFSATRRTNIMLYPTEAYIRHVSSYLEPGVPAVTELPVFPLLHDYDPAHQYLFLTDWDYDNDPAHLADYSGERLMENWKSAGYLSQNILPCKEIFTRYPKVDLLIGPHLTAWFGDMVLHDPALRVTPLGSVHVWDGVDIYSVERISPGPLPC